MVWSRTSDWDEHRTRSRNLTPAYEGPRGIPHVTDEQAGLGQSGRRAAREGRAGSRGGAPIWVLHGEGFGLMPEDLARKRVKEGGRWAPTDSRARPERFADRTGGGGYLTSGRCNACGSPFHRSAEHEASADPEGFAVFGRFPKGFLRHVIKLQLLGPVRRDEILHVCSGTLSETERCTVDIRPQARPRVIADGKTLPFRDASFEAILIDPPYSDQYARNLYGVENPRPSWLLKEAARIVVPGGRIGILHVALPFAPPGCRLVRVWPVSTGVGFRIRALTIYAKEQDRLL